MKFPWPSAINGKQEKCIYSWLLILVVIFLYAPYQYTFKVKSIYSEKAAGYHFIFEPPSPENDSPRCGIKLDISRIFLELCAATAVFLIVIILFRTRSNKAELASDVEEIEPVEKRKHLIIKCQECGAKNRVPNPPQGGIFRCFKCKAGLPLDSQEH